jgi:hypothetical protein
MVKDSLPTDRREPFERWMVTEESYSFAPTSPVAALD